MSMSAAADHHQTGRGSMKKKLLLGSFGLLLLLLVNSSAVAVDHESDRNISLACATTQFPSLCRSFILASPDAALAAYYPIQFVKVAIKVTLGELNRTLLAVDEAHKSSRGGGDEQLLYMFEDVKELLLDSQKLLISSIRQDVQINASLSNVRHWLSAALTYSNDCGDFVKRVGDQEGLLKLFDRFLVPLLSNSLWILDAFSSSLASRTDFRFWKTPGNLKREARDAGRISRELREWSQQVSEEMVGINAVGSAAAIVSHDPSFGSHATIQSAVNDAPEHLTHRYIIYIRAGVYDELVRIPAEKTMLTFIGDGINQTIITGRLSTSMNVSTYRTATLTVNGNNFMARDLTVVNSAGPSYQAVAMRVDSDMSAFHRCSFWGFQDTLYTHAYRQFYRDCTIYGSIDFIFGNAASIFQNCNIQVRPGGPNKTMSTVTAQGRTDPAQDTAFVCQSCWIGGTPEYMEMLASDPRRYSAYLGRPWKEFARAVFIESFLDLIIEPSGWLAWNGTENIATSTLAEFRNYGPGFTPDSRVSWSQQLSTIAAIQYSVRGLIQGGFWLPFTGIPFRPLF